MHFPKFLKVYNCKFLKVSKFCLDLAFGLVNKQQQRSVTPYGAGDIFFYPNLRIFLNNKSYAKKLLLCLTYIF